MKQYQQTSRRKRRLQKAQKQRNFAVGLLVFLLLSCLLGVIGWRIYEEAQYQIYPQQYEDLVEQYAEEYSLDPLLIYAVIRTESGFDETAQSNVDARGLMQITEETFDWIKSKIAREEDLVFDDLYTAEVNIRFGTYYLSRCLERYDGDVATAAAAYHSGWGTVDALLSQEAYSTNGKTLDVFPYAQMSNYVFKIEKNYTYYSELYSSQEVN